MKGSHNVLGWAHDRLLSLGLRSHESHGSHGSVVTRERKPLRALYNNFSILKF